jgi:hypothetical protein
VRAAGRNVLEKVEWVLEVLEVLEAGVDTFNGREHVNVPLEKVERVLEVLEALEAGV